MGKREYPGFRVTAPGRSKDDAAAARSWPGPGRGDGQDRADLADEIAWRRAARATRPPGDER